MYYLPDKVKKKRRTGKHYIATFFVSAVALVFFSYDTVSTYITHGNVFRAVLCYTPTTLFLRSGSHSPSGKAKKEISLLPVLQ